MHPAGSGSGRGRRGRWASRRRRRCSRPESLELCPQLVGEGDALLDEVFARPGQRSQGARLVRVGREHAQAVHVGAGELGQDVGVKPVRLAPARAVAVAGGGELVGMDGDDRDPSLEQSLDDHAVRSLERHPADSERGQAPQERFDSVLAVSVAPLLSRGSVGPDDAEPVFLAGQIDPCGPLHLMPSSTRRTGSRPTGEVPWRMLIGGPSVGRRPVAAPGASHRREALVSPGPSTRQAVEALSRRWSATTRPYEPRRSTPALTACGRTLSFQRTENCRGKVDQ